MNKEEDMETLSQKQLIKELDRQNQEKFKYVGILHIRSGYRPEVEAHREFIDSLNAEPVRVVKIQDPLTPQEKELSKHCAIIQVSRAYVNIYNADDVKDKIKGMSKHKCIGTLKFDED